MNIKGELPSTVIKKNFVESQTGFYKPIFGNNNHRMTAEKSIIVFSAPNVNVVNPPVTQC